VNKKTKQKSILSPDEAI